MTQLRLKVPLTAATLWIVLLLPALPDGASELGGESKHYAATARLADGMLDITIVNKVSGVKVSSRASTRATKLTGLRVLDTKGQVIVHGEVGSRGVIRFEYDVNDASYFDKIYQLRSESENYSVSVRWTEADPKSVLDITIVNKVSGSKVTSRAPTRTVRLTELHILEAEQRLIVHGGIGSGGDILTVVNLKDASVLDTIYGWDASFSPNKTMVAYNFRYPPYSLHQHRTSVLLIYDFSATPQENSFRDEDMADPTTRGYVIYPKRNRTLGKHFIPAMSEEEKVTFMSPLAWSHSGTRVALLEDFQENNYLLLVDLAKGLEEPEVTRLMLEKERYYKQPIEIYWNKDYAGTTFGGEDFKFSKDDTAILFNIIDTGPFAEQQAVIELD